jgi:hypothetical protein
MWIFFENSWQNVEKDDLPSDPFSIFAPTGGAVSAEQSMESRRQPVRFRILPRKKESKK